MKKIACLLIIIFTTLPAYSQENSPAEGETTLIFVRHAEKQDDGTRDPSLNEKGAQRALELSKLISTNYDLKAIYSTGYKRTKETALPVSELLDLPVNEYQLSDPDSLVKAIIELHRGEQVLIVGHSNTTPLLANIALGERTFEQLDESVYDNIFEVRIDETGKVSVNRYTYWTQGNE